MYLKPSSYRLESSSFRQLIYKKNREDNKVCISSRKEMKG